MEALANAFSGMMAQIVDPASLRETESRNLIVEEQTSEARFIGFLNELIFLVDARRWIPVRIRRLSTCSSAACDRIEAVITGEPIDEARHQFKCDIKAVTWHDFSINISPDLTTITFVCDL